MRAELQWSSPSTLQTADIGGLSPDFGPLFVITVMECMREATRTAANILNSLSRKSISSFDVNALEADRLVNNVRELIEGWKGDHPSVLSARVNRYCL